MRSFLRSSMLVVAALAAVALLPSVWGQATGGGGGGFNQPYGPMAVFHTAQSTLASRSYASCAWNTHAIIQRQQSNAFYQVGGQTVPCCNGFLGTMDVATNPAMTFSYASTFTPTNFTWAWTGFTGLNPIARVAPLAAVLSSGILVVGGGKTAPNWAYGNDVIYSTDMGRSWSLATTAAGWQVRSDGSAAVAPGTNVIVFAGGEGNNGYINDVWMSSDGLGRTWQLQTSNPGFMAFQQAPMAFLYDGTAAGGSNAMATLILYNPSDNNIYQSTSYGSSWTLVASMYVSGANPQQTGRMVADLEGYLYMAGGAEVGGQVYFSTNKGANWALMNQTTFYPGLRIADPMLVNSFEYGCLAVNYVQATGAPNGYHKQLLQYGGALTATQVINSGFQCTQQSGSAAYTSIIADLIFPGETVGTTSEWTPAGGNFGNLSMVFHDAANQLIYRAYPDWTYDVHAAITRNSTVRMWQFGGFTTGWSFIPSTDFTATGNWNSFTTFTPTYNTQLNGVTYPQPSGKVAAGVGLLANGALLLFGGKDTNASQWTNDVYLSMDNGQTWQLQTWTAPWSERSDMSVAVMPGTNVIVMGGGQGNPNSLNVQDFWYSTDGAGKVWTAGAKTVGFGVFQDAAFVALYDNNKVGGSQAYSTLLINPGIITAANADAIYSSVDAGATWQLVRTAPWTQRIRGSFVADMEGYVYMMGGQPSSAGDIWISSDKGVTWNWVRQQTQSRTWSNTFSLQSAQQNCMALRYAPNAQSPGGYHKQLVLWGGPADPALSLTSMQVSQRAAPSCVKTIPANVVYAELMFPQEQQADANGQFVDTLNTAAAYTSSQAPTIAFNNPSPLLTYRQYASCAADVHAVSRGTTPSSFALGGWDINGVALTTIDVISGTNTNGYQFVTPQWGAGLQTPSGRIAAAISAYTASGVLIWGGGKTGINSFWSNDVWYSTNQGGQFRVATLTAPWLPRSDSASTAIPTTNCVVVIGGQGVTVAVGNFQSAEVFFNDVWTSCDGQGASWQLQTAAAPFATAQQASLVALYDNTGSTSQPTSTLVYYSWADQYVRSSNNMGATWKTLGTVSWSQRLARFVADANNNIYMPGGMNPNNNNGDGNGLQGYNQGIGDVWYSNNKGASWSRLSQVTGAGYTNPVTLSTASYSCATLVPGTAPHNQVFVYSNWIEVFSGTAQVVAQPNGFFQPTAQCSCDSLTGIRSVVGDLIFPGETPNNLPSSASSSSSSKTFSQGATAGIAVGVGVGCMLLCCLLFAFFFLGTAQRGSSKDKDLSTGGTRHKHMDEEVSTNSVAQPSGVEMESRP